MRLFLLLARLEFALLGNGGLDIRQDCLGCIKSLSNDSPQFENALISRKRGGRDESAFEDEDRKERMDSALGRSKMGLGIGFLGILRGDVGNMLSVGDLSLGD